MTSYPRPSTSTSLGLRHSGGESGSSSLDWSSNYARPSGDAPSKLYSSSASSNFASDADGRFSASSERNRAVPSIPGLGNFDCPVPDKPVVPTESRQLSDILLHLGLEKEDLNYLCLYPDEEITPANLPFIMQQIRIEKAKRSTNAAQPKPSLGPQPSRGAGGTDGHSLSTSGGARMQKEGISPSRHTSKYPGEVVDEIGSTSRDNSGGSEGISLMDTCESSRHSREPLQKNLPEIKSSALGSSRDQASSVSSLSSSYSSAQSSVAPLSSDQTKRLQTLTNQTFQPIFSSSSLLKKDVDMRVFKTEAPKPVPLNQPETDRQSSLNTQPPHSPPGFVGGLGYGSHFTINLAAQPTEAMMHDCTGVTPRTFPHTCCLCDKNLSNLKNWIAHRNTSLHLENCRNLRKQYPKWDGEITCAAGKDAEASHRHQKSRHGRSRSRRHRRLTLSRTSDLRQTPTTVIDLTQSPPRTSDLTQTPPIVIDLTQTPPRTGDPRQTPPRRSDKSRSPIKRSDPKPTPPRTSDKSRSPIKRSDPKPTPPRTSEPKPTPPRTSDKSRSPLRRSDPRRSPQQKSSNTPERLVKKHLETSAKLAKIELPKSPSSSAASPSITSSLTKELAQKYCEVKTNTSSSTKSKFAKSPPPSMVKLEGILDSITRADVFAAVEDFGKTKSLLLFRSKQEVVMFFEDEDDAEKLRSVKILRVKEVTLTVIGEKEAGSQQLHEKLSTVVSTTTRKPLLPTPNKPPLQSPSPLCSGARSPQQVRQTSEHSPDKDSEVEVKEEEGGPRVVTAEVKAENPADKRSESGAAKSPADTSVKAPAYIQQSSSSEPESTARGPKTKTKTCLTAGDCSEEKLHQDRPESCRKQSMSEEKKLLLVTNLPKYVDGCYSEDDLVELLSPFGFQHSDNSLHVVPQTCMAFVSMPTVESRRKVTSASAKDGIVFKGSKLVFQEMANDITATPLRFYKSLMELMRFIVVNDGERIIFIKNISWSESKQLRDALEKIGSVKNFLPLLNEVFVEFVSVRDADRLGVWYSLLKRVPDHEVHRLKAPLRACTSLPPSLPENALPDSKDAVAGATVPPIGINVPHGSFAPFWVTMKTRPFLFPTMSPWFIIPEFLTVRRKGRAEQGRFMIPTIMLTGLPEGNYKHEDVAKLVWRYFPKQNLNSLYYNVTVLTLQRRAFVFFTDWTSCSSFVQDHLKKPVCVQGCQLSVHFVLKHMSPESSEEMMYATMMKLSNAGVPEPESLEERLLCVEISETSLDVIKAVMEVVASIATFVSFLPLANRICIEMTESSGVAQVVEEHHTNPLLWRTSVRSKIRRVESLKSLKKRLKDCDEMTVEL